MSSILDAIASDPNVAPEITAKLRSIISTKSVKKGEILQRQGDLNDDVYFVKYGLLRSYIVDEKNREHTILLAPEGTLFSNIDSTFNKSPSPVYIDALEDTELELFNKDHAFQISYIPSAILFYIINKMLHQLISIQNKIILLMSATASERFRYFNEVYPDMLQRVPQKIIASYLAMTPQVLSKLRAENKTQKTINH